MKLYEVATSVGVQTHTGLFSLASELRQHLDEEVVATFCREVVREIDSNRQQVSSVPDLTVTPIRNKGKEIIQDAFQVSVSCKSGFERFLTKLFFVQEGDRFSIRRDLRQLSLI